MICNSSFLSHAMLTITPSSLRFLIITARCSWWSRFCFIALPASCISWWEWSIGHISIMLLFLFMIMVCVFGLKELIIAGCTRTLHVCILFTSLTIPYKLLELWHRQCFSHIVLGYISVVSHLKFWNFVESSKCVNTLFTSVSPQTLPCSYQYNQSINSVFCEVTGAYLHKKGIL